MIEKDFRIQRWKCWVSLKCCSLKDYLCLCFGCHLLVFKGKADFRNWSSYPLSKPKWAELKRDLRLLQAALLWRLVITLAWGQWPRLDWPAAVNEGLLQSHLNLFHTTAHLLDSGWERWTWGRKRAIPLISCFQACDNQKLGTSTLRLVPIRMQLGSSSREIE